MPYYNRNAGTYSYKNYVKNITGWDGDESNKPRDLLQSIGIDLIKNKIDKHLLIRRVIEDIKVYSYFYDIIVVTDARLLDEIEIPKKYFNVTTIRINNSNNNLTNEQKNHITETNLDNYEHFDYVIDDLENINKILEEL